jgi:outer membrane receptor protein involved in Fe transport
MIKQHMHRRGAGSPRSLARLPLTAAICFVVGSAALAQSAPPAEDSENKAVTLDQVIVTSQKRSENLQDVPISLQVLDATRLDQLNVTSFEDYVKYLPSVAYESSGPGFARIYMRGVASGGDGNHSGSLPSVGVYLDEQPVTTIQGPLDIHVYDIERVESLSGPQSTLYGASSQAGTLRIITNKPDPSGFEGGYTVGVDTTSGGSNGYVGEGFVNVPVSDNAAIRLVAWKEKEGGYIDNIAGTRTYPSWDADSGGNGTENNADLAREDYNNIDTEGARLALRVTLGDRWTITPTVMHQRQSSDGFFAFDPEVGDLAVTHFNPEGGEDRWTQAALTVEGKIGNFDVTYAFANLDRDVDSESDYSDYAFWYDTLAGYGAYFVDNDGDLVNPSQYIQAVDGYKRSSHELRFASSQENRLRFVGGFFLQNQDHDIQQRYKIDGIASAITVTGWPDTLWLTKQFRQDNDKAVFGEFAYDITDQLTATLGGRYFRVDNGLKGFFGFSSGYSSRTGEAACFDSTDFNGAPCINLDKRVKESGSIGKANITYKLDDDRMVYLTWSEGYRPGGINRRGTLPPYLSDYLTNIELGWKSTWADNRLSFNASVFRQDWEDFQFSILGANGLTEIKNANQATIDGLEVDLNWAATYNLQIGGGFAMYNAKLTANYCGFTDANGVPVTTCATPEAPSGTQLPVTPKFKGNLIARYSFDFAGGEAYWQSALSHVGERTSDLRLLQRSILGNLEAYTTADFSAGYSRDNWSVDVSVSNLTDERAEVSKFTACAETVCGAAGVVPEYPNGQVYTNTIRPRTFGIRFSQKF